MFLRHFPNKEAATRFFVGGEGNLLWRDVEES